MRTSSAVYIERLIFARLSGEDDNLFHKTSKHCARVIVRS